MKPVLITDVLIERTYTNHSHVYKDSEWLPGVNGGPQVTLPPQWHLGVVSIVSWRRLTEQERREGHSDLPLAFLPETGHKTLMWGAPSLLLEERSILLSEDRGTPRSIRTRRSCYASLSYCTHLILLDVLCSSTTGHLHHTLIEMLRSKCVLGSSLPYEGSCVK